MSDFDLLNVINKSTRLINLSIIFQVISFCVYRVDLKLGQIQLYFFFISKKSCNRRETDYRHTCFIYIIICKFGK